MDKPKIVAMLRALKWKYNMFSELKGEQLKFAARKCTKRLAGDSSSKECYTIGLYRNERQGFDEM